MSNPAPPDVVDRLDARVVARIQEMERMLGCLAHRMGGVMLPTLKDDPERAGDRGWTRLMFQAGSMKDHIVRQKHALDFVRGKTVGEMAALPATEWSLEIPDVLQGLVVRGEAFRLVLESDVAIGLSLTRAITTLVIAIDEQAPELCVQHVTIRIENGALELTAALDANAAAAPLVPSCLSRAWRDACDATVDVTAREIRIHGTYSGER